MRIVVIIAKSTVQNSLQEVDCVIPTRRCINFITSSRGYRRIRKFYNIAVAVNFDQILRRAVESIIKLYLFSTLISTSERCQQPFSIFRFHFTVPQKRRYVHSTRRIGHVCTKRKKLIVRCRQTVIACSVLTVRPRRFFARSGIRYRTRKLFFARRAVLCIIKGLFFKQIDIVYQPHLMFMVRNCIILTIYLIERFFFFRHL